MISNLTFDSLYLQSIYGTFNKRTKSLKKRGYKPRVQRFLERDGDAEWELLSLECRAGSNSVAPSIQTKVWSDRLVWVDARRWSQDGWVWTWTIEGRLLGEPNVTRFVDAYERTISLASFSNNVDAQVLNKLWSPFLATYPKLVRGS